MNNLTETTINLGNQILSKAIAIGINCTIETYSKGDGNCGWHSLVDQLKRRDIFNQNKNRLQIINQCAQKKYHYLKREGDDSPNELPYLTHIILRQIICDHLEAWIKKDRINQR